MRRQTKRHKFYGAATLGNRGLIVVPAEARKAMDLRKGDKLLVIGMESTMITCTKSSGAKLYASHLSDHLSAIRKAKKNNTLFTPWTS